MTATSTSLNPNPFPGLRPFYEDEEHLFFGRESQVDTMVDKLAATRFLAVIGTSGSGKSSLVNCGLRPALHRGLLAKAGTSWRMVQFRPGNNPLRALAEALAADGVLFQHLESGPLSPADMVEATLRLSRRGLIDVYEQANPMERVNLLVVVDQFEELFRYQAQSQETLAFTNLLLEARAQTGVPIYVVLTMRSDFLGDCAAIDGLPEAINQGQYLIPRMTREERRAAIVGPISVGGAGITQILLTRLVNDVGDNPDQLSILQHALNRTWARWQNDDGRHGDLDLPHYEATGTMSHALDRHAEKAYGELSADNDRRVCEAIFKALTDKGTDPRGVRRPMRLGTLCELARASRDEVVQVIDVFRKPSRSFLMAGTRQLDNDTVIDISHESLMRVWDRLRAWADQEAHSAQLYGRLAEAAALHSEGKYSLWRDPELQVALEWRQKEQPTDAWAALYGGGFQPAMTFLDASETQRRKEISEQEEHQRNALDQARALADERQHRIEAQDAATRRLQRWLAALATVTLLTVIVGFYGWTQQRKAIEARSDAVREARHSNARRLAADALEEARNNLDVALLVSVEASRLSDKSDVSARLLTALRSVPNLTGFLRPGHADAVRSLAFSSDGKMLASASKDSSILLWDFTRRERLSGPLKHESYVFSVAFGNGDKTLASGGADKTIRLWNVETGEAAGPPVKLPADVYSVAFSPDGNLLASAGADGLVRLWNLASQGGSLRLEPLAELRGHTGAVHMVAFSPTDGRLLASAGADKKVILWDTLTRKTRGTLSGHTKEVWSVAFSPDGKRLASGGSDTKVLIWELATQRMVGAPLRGHTGSIFNVAFSIDSRQLASTDADGKVMLWEIGSHGEPGASQPASRELNGYKSPVYGLAFSPSRDVDDILVTGTEDGSIIRWDYPARLGFGEGVPLTESVSRVVFSPDGKTLATALSDNTISLSDLRTRDSAIVVPRKFPGDGHKQPITGLAFSLDGTLLASGSLDGTILFWDVASLQKEGVPLTGHGGAAVNALAFSPDGQKMASGGADGTIVLWDVASRKPVPGHKMVLAKGGVLSLAFGSDQDVLASGGEDGSVAVWSISAREKVGDAFTAGPNGQRTEGVPVNALAFSPDGRTLASGVGKRIVLWNMAKRKQVPGSPLTEHTEDVTSLTFSPDGAILASGSLDTNIILWNLETLHQIGLPLSQHQAGVNSVTFSRDGRTLASASDSIGTNWSVLLWDFSAESWRSKACAVASRSLTKEEWERWFGEDRYDANACPMVFVKQANAAALAGDREIASATFASSVALAIKSNDAALNNQVCFLGAIDGFSDVVLSACDRAVNLSGDPFFRDTRAVALAQLGRYEEAVKDFTSYLEWSKDKEEHKALRPKREAWVVALKEGRNPFDKTTLRNLRRE